MPKSVGADDLAVNLLSLISDYSSQDSYRHFSVS